MSRIFDELKEGLEQAIKHAEGSPSSTEIRERTFEATEIREARLKTGLTQQQFASVLGASVATLQKWEQGTRVPSGAAARLIKIIAYRPSIVKEALGFAPTPAKRRPRSAAA
jgi:putative transcriptional regulator